MTTNPQDLDALVAKARDGICVMRTTEFGFMPDFRATNDILNALADAITTLRRDLEQAKIDAEFFKDEVKLRNRIPATADPVADLQRKVEKLERDLLAADAAATERVIQFFKDKAGDEEWSFDELREYVCSPEATSTLDAVKRAEYARGLRDALKVTVEAVTEEEAIGAILAMIPEGE
jgi:hypothetical protein